MSSVRDDRDGEVAPFTPTSAPKRVNVQFTAEAYAVLQDLAREQGKTMSELLRDAVKLERYFFELRKERARVLIERDGKIRELLSI